MKKDLDRRAFLRIAGASMGVGALYTAWPGLGSAEGAEVARRLGMNNGERPSPFTFAQLSDAHVGFRRPDRHDRAREGGGDHQRHAPDAGPRPVHRGPHA